MSPPSQQRKTKETEEQRCLRKLRHMDYLGALLHARALGDDKIGIYPCDVCKGLHLGHNKIRFVAHCEREGKARAASLLRRIQRHERVIAKHLAIAGSLRDELERIVIYYALTVDLP
jgi:hypothetical protein